MKNVSILKAGLISRSADYLQYTPDNKITEVMGARPIGGLSINQVSKDFHEPSVQSAIDDLKYRAEIPVGGLFLSSDGNDPSAISQSDQFVVKGQVIGEGTEATLLFLGIPVKVAINDTPDTVASKIVTTLNDYVVAGLYFSTVISSTGTETIISVTYNDYQYHQFGTFFSKGITFEQTIVSPAKAGYGNWENQGTQSVNLVGGVGGDKTITTYYFKRTS